MRSCSLRQDFTCISENAGLSKLHFYGYRYTAVSLMLIHRIQVIVVSG
jgi:hypothetical protein